MYACEADMCGRWSVGRLWMGPILPRLSLVLLLLVSLNSIFAQSVGAQIASHVVVNEVELDPPTDQRTVFDEWVELYNPTDSSVDISGWRISTAHGRTVTVTIAEGTILQPKGRCVVMNIQPRSSCNAPTGNAQWLDDGDESVVLRDSAGDDVDRTPLLSDSFNDDRSWQRYPDGKDTDSSADWPFARSTKLTINIPEFPVGTLVLVVSMVAVGLLLRFVKRARNPATSDSQPLSTYRAIVDGF